MVFLTRNHCLRTFFCFLFDVKMIEISNFFLRHSFQCMHIKSLSISAIVNKMMTVQHVKLILIYALVFCTNTASGIYWSLYTSLFFCQLHIFLSDFPSFFNIFISICVFSFKWSHIFFIFLHKFYRFPFK